MGSTGKAAEKRGGDGAAGATAAAGGGEEGASPTPAPVPPRPAAAAVRRRLPRWLFYALPALAVLLAVVWFRSRPKVVDVVTPVVRTVIESIAATGQVEGDVETSVGASGGGRVVAVPVREGTRVRRGDVLARLDDRVLQSQARQTAEAVQTGKAQLTQASRPPLASDVARLRADTEQAVRVAEAQLAASRQRLAELRRGPTREEREQAEAQAQQAEAQVEEAQVRLAQAERDRERQELLFEQGAVARVEYERALTARDAAAATVEATQKALASERARLRQLQVGTRPEQIAQARADVVRHEAQVRGARRSGEAQLRSLLASPRPEDVAVARARLEEARQGLAVARQRLEETVVRAPFDGTVTQVVTEAGGVTGPNQPLVRLVRTTRPELRIDVDEANLGRVRLGQQAVVTNDAFAGESFAARVSELGARVDSERGTIEVRLIPEKVPSWLRPGQTVSVNIVVDEGTRRLVVPLTAVTTIGGLTYVLVVTGENRVERRDVAVGPSGPEGVPVLEGLSEKDRVLVNPTVATPGEAVAVRAVPAPSAAAPSAGGS